MGPPEIASGVEEDISRLIDLELDRRNGPLALQLLIKRLHEDFGSFLDAAMFAAKPYRGSQALEADLDVVSYPGRESGVDDLRLWLLRLRDRTILVGLARGTVEEARNGRAAERDRIRSRVAAIMVDPGLTLVWTRE